MLGHAGPVDPHTATGRSPIGRASWGRARERRSAAAVGHVPAPPGEARRAVQGPVVLARAPACMAELGVGPRGHPPRYGRRLAPPRIRVVLDTPVAADRWAPPVDQDLRRLIRQMAAANPLWGTPRIHGELRKLGLDVSERTVSRLVPHRRRPPSQTWRAFLQNHVGSLVAVDFFAVTTITRRVLFVLVLLAHDRRRILHVNVTPHPTSAWTRQQLREAFPWSTPRYLLHDRDAVFDAAFSRTADALGMTEVRTAPRSPWQNPSVERVIGSIRRECLDHVIALSERHLQRLLRAYVAYYQHTRTHLALAKDTPEPRPVHTNEGRVVAIPEVGGLHHRYKRRAA
jgi:putative transposase